MGKHRLGWPDLLLINALVVALNGYFYAAMGSLVVYAVLYRRATVRHRRYTDERECGCRWRRDGDLVIFSRRCDAHAPMCRAPEHWELELTARSGR